MLFNQDLENIIFTRNQLFHCDELVIISGYVGPSPIQKLSTLPLTTTVIYGMYGCDGIKERLHNALLSKNKQLNNVNILYSSIPVHAKCYIWKNHGEVVHALIGSANFSTSGLTNPFKEVLAETTIDTFAPLQQYMTMVLNNSIKCEDAEVNHHVRPQAIEPEAPYNTDVCQMPLYNIKNGIPQVPEKSGINWGLARLTGSHVNLNDAYIKISSNQLKHYPNFFPEKQKCPSDNSNVTRTGHRHNDNIEIIWDDGTIMTGLLEGSSKKKENGETKYYPKQISTTPSKAELGEYLRRRIGVDEGRIITYEDLQKYGRTTIDVSLQEEGIYYFDFSVDKDAINTMVSVET